MLAHSNPDTLRSRTEEYLMNRTRFTVPLAIGLAVLAGPLLTGCSVQNIVHNVTGGTVDIPSTSVPKDFPSEVPLAKGEVVLGAAIGGKDGKIWNVTIKVAGASSLVDIAKQLQSAGFTADGTFGGNTDGGTGAFKNSSYGVLVVVSKDGKNGWIANYTVTKAASK
jgi:hypothetical protein